MAERNDNAPAPPAGQEPKQELPLDTRLLSDAVIELNISRKNVGIYPPGHIQITRSIDRAFEVFHKLFEVRKEITLGIAKDTLFVGHDYLDRQNPVYRDFALSLNGQGIAAVTFFSGLDRDELVRFHRIITTRPEEVAAAGGIMRVAGDAGLVHIRLVPIDYSSFHLTEEQEVSRTTASRADQEGPGLWADFVTHLAGGTIAGPGQKGISLADAEQIDPAELARLLNERKLDTGQALHSYEHVITGHVRARAEQKQLSRAQSETLRSLNSLVKDLHPDLRKQFLAVTFQGTADASPAATEEVMGGLNDDMVLEMLQQASAEGREISPTLTGILQKMSGAAATEGPGPSPKGSSQQALSQEQVQALFDREQYESYVSNDYAADLQRMAAAGAVPATGAFPIDEYAASMTDERLDYQIGRVLLGFIDEDIADDDYGEFLKKVMANAPEMLKTGQYALLHDTYETLRLHSREKKSLGVRAMVEVALRGFKTPDFITAVVEAFGTFPDRDTARQAGQFLLALGDEALLSLFDLYSQDETPGGRRAVFDLLCRFGQAAVREAVRRLDNPRPPVVRNLVMLIRWEGDRSVVSSLRPLLRHPDQGVRLEAVTALLRFRDPSAFPALREAIKAEDLDIFSRGVSLAGQYRVTAVVEALVGRLKRMILFEGDYEDNEMIIRALGEIGDSRALPELERLAKGSWPLYPKSRNRMKATLFASLERYRRKDIDGLLRIGEQSEDPRVLRACKGLREGTKRA